MRAQRNRVVIRADRMTDRALAGRGMIVIFVGVGAVNQRLGDKQRSERRQQSVAQAKAPIAPSMPHRAPHSARS